MSVTDPKTLKIRLEWDEDTFTIYDITFKLQKYSSKVHQRFHLTIEIDEEGYFPITNEYFFNHICEINKSYNEEEYKMTIHFNNNTKSLCLLKRGTFFLLVNCFI